LIFILGSIDFQRSSACTAGHWLERVESIGWGSDWFGMRSFFGFFGFFLFVGLSLEWWFSIVQGMDEGIY